VGGAALLQRRDVRSLVPFGVLGVTCWYALYQSGVHATLSGVAFGLLCPAFSFYDPDRFGSRARTLVDRVEDLRGDQIALRNLGRLTAESEPPLDRIVDRLGPWVSFAIVPLFALANAGVRLSGDVLRGAPTDRVVLGVTVGLLLGKTVGVFSASWLACRAGLGKLPPGTGWSDMFGVAICAGIGFTVALFVTGLSFHDAGLVDQAKIGILAGSILSGAVGYAYLRARSNGRSMHHAAPVPEGAGR
jgi:NhaA family Na+:H+ antiporter